MTGLLAPDFDWSTPRAELREITPEEARAILADRNPRPESVSPYRVTELADELRAGAWTVNGETVTFWPDGSLRNGRHRLWACVVSGAPLRTYVAFATE